jgi:hypothetical protein
MSTRGTYGIRMHQKDKLMYNHSDSYPSWLGTHLLSQLRSIVAKPNGLHEFKLKAEKFQVVDADVKPTEQQKKDLAPYANFGVDSGKPDSWYCLTRNLQGDLEKSIEAGIGLDAGEFIYDSLFCEWAYIVNLDTNKFEVYKGFQEKKHKKGRYGQKTNSAGDRDKYYGCALVGEFDLENLPTDDDFLEKVEPRETEDL